jgi:hypothetical protein
LKKPTEAIMADETKETTTKKGPDTSGTAEVLPVAGMPGGLEPNSFESRCPLPQHIAQVEANVAQLKADAADAQAEADAEAAEKKKAAKAGKK